MLSVHLATFSDKLLYFSAANNKWIVSKSEKIRLILFAKESQRKFSRQNIYYLNF